VKEGRKLVTGTASRAEVQGLAKFLGVVSNDSDLQWFVYDPPKKWYKRIWWRLKLLFRKPPAKYLPRWMTMSLVEEMFLRGHLSAREVVQFESSLGYSDRLNPQLLEQVKSFAKSDEWKTLRRPGLPNGSSVIGGLIGFPPLTTSAYEGTARPRDPVLKGSKAAEQQVLCMQQRSQWKRLRSEEELEEYALQREIDSHTEALATARKKLEELKKDD